MPAIRACLEHRHSYVRRNAVCAIFTIYKNFEFLIPDAPELVTEYFKTEQDASCMRYPNEYARFIRCVYNLLQFRSPAVRYEAAGTLVTLTNTEAAVKVAASAYIELIVKESDNNVKLIVLDRLVALHNTSSNEKVLQGLVMDILRVLTSPGLEVCKKTPKLAPWFSALVKTLHTATIKFPLLFQAEKTRSSSKKRLYKWLSLPPEKKKDLCDYIGISKTNFVCSFLRRGYMFREPSEDSIALRNPSVYYVIRSISNHLLHRYSGCATVS